MMATAPVPSIIFALQTRHRRARAGILLLLLLLSTLLPGQSSRNAAAPEGNFRESGLPFLRYISPKEHGESTQNFDIAEDNRGLIYVANAYGILEYDGVSWREIRGARNTSFTTRSVAVDSSSRRVYVGLEGDFGYLESDAAGRTTFRSLRDFIPEDSLEFKDVWRTHATDKGIYFLSQNHLFRWDGQRIKVWENDKGYDYAFPVNNRYLVSAFGSGLMEMRDSTLVPLPGGDFLADKTARLVLPLDSRRMLIGVNSALYTYDGSHFQPFSGEVNAFLAEHFLTGGIFLPGRQIALATDRGGCAVIDTLGRIRQVIGKSAGLRDLKIHSLTTDRQGGLWLATNNGLARAELPAPLTILNEHHGLEGSVNQMLRHQGAIYAATSTGVYKLLPASITAEGVYNAPRFEQPIIGEVWAMLSMQNRLLLGTNSGIYQIVAGELSRIETGWREAVYSFHRSAADPSRVLAGLHNGLAMLQLANGRWQDEGKLPEIGEQIRTIVETPDGTVWLGSQYRGAIRIEGLFPAGNAAPRVTHFDAGQGLEKIYTGVHRSGERVLFATERGLRRFDPAGQRFVPDSTLAPTLADSNKWIFRIIPAGDGRLWVNYRLNDKLVRKIVLLIPETGGSYRWVDRPFNRLSPEDYDRIYCIYPDPAGGGLTWFGGPNGIIRYQPGTAKSYTAPFSVQIRRVSYGSDSLLYDGGVAPAQQSGDPSPSSPVLAYADNTIRLGYAPGSSDAPGAMRYRYRLEGFEHDWSDWQGETQKEYTNLPEGRYRFRVQAKNIYEQLSSEASYAFRVQPPWYRSWWAYGIYALGLILLLYGIVKQRTRAYQERNRQLEATVQARTRDLHERNNELRQTLEQLQKTQKQLLVQEKLASLGALTAGIAHEIKNPLNFINNFSDLAIELIQDLTEELEKAGSALPSESREIIEELLNDLVTNSQKINQHGRRADSIVKGMLMHSRGKAGERQITDVNALLEEYVNLAYHGMRAQDTSFNITIHQEYDHDIKPFPVVPQDLSRALLNILNNACYATHQKFRDRKASGNAGGESPGLWVQTKDRGKRMEIRIRDNGAGIPKEIRDKIFNPFFTTKPTGEGTGLGLSMTHEIIVQEHHGSITVNTEAGQYSEFVIELPKE